jgi:hypothetical protein
MGTYASVLVFPWEPRKPSLFTRLFRPEKIEALPLRPPESMDLDKTARKILHCFERHGFLRQGVAEEAIHSESLTFGTHCIRDNTRHFPAGLQFCHLTARALDLQLRVREIVWTQTVRELYAELTIPDDENPEELALPHLDIMVFSRPVRIYDSVRTQVVCNPWVLIEFSFEDCRLSEEIHRIRNTEHAIFRDLELIFGCAASWDYCAG